MPRDSKIPHPAGGIFLQIHHWALRAVGRDAAAILGHLDFLDRPHEHEGMILASRARLLADLEGFVSRCALDKALADLEEIGWIQRHKREIFSGRNLSTIHEFSLCSSKIAEFLKPQNADVLNLERRRSDFGTDSRTDDRTDRGTPSIEKKKNKKEAALKCGDESVQHGVEVWTKSDATCHQRL